MQASYFVHIEQGMIKGPPVCFFQITSIKGNLTEDDAKFLKGPGH